VAPRLAAARRALPIQAVVCGGKPHLDAEVDSETRDDVVSEEPQIARAEPNMPSGGDRAGFVPAKGAR